MSVRHVRHIVFSDWTAPATTIFDDTMSTKAIADVWKACADISGADPNSQPDSDTSLFDMGLDSLGLAELVIQLEEVYGEGSLTVDDILAAPTLREVASCLPGAAGAPAAPAPVKAAPVKAAPNVVVAPAAKPTPRHPSSSTPKNAPPPMYKTATPARKPTPVAPKPTPVAATPRTPANGAAQAIIERLAKLENESRELRSLVGSLAIGSTPVPMAPITSVVPEADDIQAEMCYEEGCEAPPSVEDEWIRTTHVGSLPRAAKGESGDIMEIVRMQLASGLDIINDGEWSRDNYVRLRSCTLAPTHHPTTPTQTHPRHQDTPNKAHQTKHSKQSAPACRLILTLVLALSDRRPALSHRRPRLRRRQGWRGHAHVFLVHVRDAARHGHG